MRHYSTKFGTVRLLRRLRGLVIRPTYGIRVKRAVEDIIKKECLVLWALKEPDFTSSQKRFDGFAPKNAIAYADHNDGAIILNATALAQLSQRCIDFALLHEIQHLLHCTNDEAMTNANTFKLAKRLGIRVEKP